MGCSLQYCIFVQCCPGVFLVQCQWNVKNAATAGVYYQKIIWSKIKIARKWLDVVQCWTVQRCLKSLEKKCIEFFYVQYFRSSINTLLHSVFSVQCCLEPLAQHCIGFLSVKCCSRSIRATLHRIFSGALLPGVSWITLHRLTCVAKSWRLQKSQFSNSLVNWRKFGCAA